MSQSPFIKAYWELVDASGLSDEEFEQRMEEAAAAKYADQRAHDVAWMTAEERDRLKP